MAAAERQYELVKEELQKMLHEKNRSFDTVDAAEYVKLCVAIGTTEQQKTSIINRRSKVKSLDAVRTKALKKYRAALKQEASTTNLLQQIIGVLLTVTLFLLGFLIRDIIQSAEPEQNYVTALVAVLLFGILLGWVLRALKDPVMTRVFEWARAYNVRNEAQGKKGAPADE